MAQPSACLIVHFVGDDLAVDGVLDRHPGAGDDAALGAVHHHVAAAGLHHGAGSDALDPDVAARIVRGAADQVAVQQHRAAARDDIAEHVGMDGDALAFDHALFLHLAEFLVVAGELQVAGGARRDAVAADDLVADRDLARSCGSTFRKPACCATRNSPSAVCSISGAGAGHRRQVDVGRHGRLDRDAGQLEADRRRPRAALSCSSLTSFWICGKRFWKAIRSSLPLASWRGASLRWMSSRHLDDLGVAPGRRVEPPRHRHPLGLAAVDRRAHRADVDAEADPLVPHVGDEFVDVERVGRPGRPDRPDRPGTPARNNIRPRRR